MVPDLSSDESEVASTFFYVCGVCPVEKVKSVFIGADTAYNTCTYSVMMVTYGYIQQVPNTKLYKSVTKAIILR